MDQKQSYASLMARSPGVATKLPNGWRVHSPAVRQKVIEALLAREDRIVQLLSAAEQGTASVAYVDSSRRTLLLKHGDKTIRKLAEKLFGEDAPGERGEAIVQYKMALNQASDAIGGEKVCRDCMSCHKVGNIVTRSARTWPRRHPATPKRCLCTCSIPTDTCCPSMNSTSLPTAMVDPTPE